MNFDKRHYNDECDSCNDYKLKYLPCLLFLTFACSQLGNQYDDTSSVKRTQKILTKCAMKQSEEIIQCNTIICFINVGGAIVRARIAI